MIPRRLLTVPLLLVGMLLGAALGGYAVGAYLTARTIDRADPAASPGDGAGARTALAALRARAADEGLSPEALAQARREFLTRWPDSWLRLRWQVPRR